MAANGSASPRLGKRSRDEIEETNQPSGSGANADGNSGTKGTLSRQLIDTRYIL